MNKEEMNAKFAEWNAKMKDLGEKTKDAVDTAKIKDKFINSWCRTSIYESNTWRWN